MTSFENALRGLAWRLWMRRCIEKLLLWGFYGASTGLAFVVLSKFLVVLPVNNTIVLSLFSLPLLGLGIGLSLGLFQKPSLAEAILWIDETGRFNDTLPTIWECLQKPRLNQVENVLINRAAVLVERIPNPLVFQGFNVNGIFKLLIAYSVIGLVWWLPASTSAAALTQQRLNQLMSEEAIKIKKSLMPVDKNDLDYATRNLLERMDGLAELMMGNKIEAEALLRKMEELSTRVDDDLYLLGLAQGLKQQIALSLGQVMPDSAMPFSATDEITRRLLTQLEERIREGHIALDTQAQLMNILKDLQHKSAGSAELEQALKEAQHYLETQEGSLVEPLAELFQLLAHKNQEILERLRNRLDITMREIDQVQGETVELVTEAKSVGTGFSRVPPASKELISDTGLDSTTTSTISTRLDELKLRALEVARQNREAALQKPFWPAGYDLVIKEYFR